MKEFSYLTTKSTTTTAKIKQFFSHFLFLCSFFPYLLMENLRSRFKPFQPQQSSDLDSVIETQKQRLKISHTPAELGSERKEIEWIKTLACKLYQERNNAGAGEGMDLLWEVYEKTEEEGKQSKVSEAQVNAKTRILDFLEEEEEEEVEDSNLCCLKALRFSAGKPGMLNFSKAFKRIKPGWLKHHHHRRKKCHSK